ncbi:hypothetical protein [Streptomyces sp. NPDC086989]|uniref:hypothetical protein n=1 Tax=Streptomyces sp. NPDC086989 TaxID=3365764 RepID=UPI0038260FAD
MRAQLLEYFPALERAFDYAASKAALILLTGYQTPAGLRRLGPSRLTTWLKNRKVRDAQAMADAAVAAAQAQHTAVAGESTAAAVVNALARSVLALDEEIAAIDAQIAVRFREHRHAEVVLSMPGMGPLPGAEFIACTGGDMDAFGSADRLARRRRSRSGPTGLRSHQRQHAPTTPLPPPTPARLLPLRPDRRPFLPHLEGLLRP